MIFFKFCSEDDFAKTLLCTEVPSYFTWRDKSGTRGKKEFQLTWLLQVRPVGKGLHSLSQEQRMLLSQDAAPQSSRPNLLQQLENLRKPAPPTKGAYFKRGLLESDQHWDDALTKASLSRLPSHLRHLFAMMLQMCEGVRPIGTLREAQGIPLRRCLLQLQKMSSRNQ